MWYLFSKWPLKFYSVTFVLFIIINIKNMKLVNMPLSMQESDTRSHFHKKFPMDTFQNILLNFYFLSTFFLSINFYLFFFMVCITEIYNS